MLVLSRRVDEKIIIRDTETAETLTIMLVEIVTHNGTPSRVRLGIEASPRFVIAREELGDAGGP